MSAKHKKLEQIKLQHAISRILHEDNGVSCHFDYHVNLISEDETIKLNLLTYNERHDEYMLMHTTKGTSSLECLAKMLEYVKSNHQVGRLDSYTVRWKREGQDQVHYSHFRAPSEEFALKKFLHEKNPGDYEIISVEGNPVA